MEAELTDDMGSPPLTTAEAPTPPQSRKRLGLVVGAAMIPLLIGWWFCSDLLIAALRPFAAVMFAALGLSTDIKAAAPHDWLVETNLMIATGPQASALYSFKIAALELRRVLLGFPIFLALWLAPPRAKRWTSGLLIGLAILAVVFCASAAGLAANPEAVVVNHHVSAADDNMAPPNFTVSAPPMGGVSFFLAGLAYYLALQVVPLAAPLVVWLALNPRARAVLLSRFPSARLAEALQSQA